MIGCDCSLSDDNGQVWLWFRHYLHVKRSDHLLHRGRVHPRHHQSAQKRVWASVATTHRNRKNCLGKNVLLNCADIFYRLDNYI